MVQEPEQSADCQQLRHRSSPTVSEYLRRAESAGLTWLLPARAIEPRDKAKVESGVLVVERWILGALRHRQFFSLTELNTAIGELLETLNTRPFPVGSFQVIACVLK